MDSATYAGGQRGVVHSLFSSSTMPSSGSQRTVGITHFYNSRNVGIEDSTFCARDDGSQEHPGGRISFGDATQGMVIKGSMIHLTAGSPPGGYSSLPPPPPPGSLHGMYGSPYGPPYGGPYPPYPPYGTYPPPPPPSLRFYPNGLPIEYSPTSPWPGYGPPPAPYEPPPPLNTEMNPTRPSRRGHSSIPTPSETIRHERRRKSPRAAREVSPSSPPRPASMSRTTPIDTRAPAPKNAEPLIPMRPMSPLSPLESMDEDDPSDSTENLGLNAEVASESSNMNWPRTSS
ncbi:unnamed protein product [Cyclocybe aegerita]|uniref:Uncharacterized protein n=1 Tax=Cyclocybe aegerita TaxID=1973307 RepID=A0A8S0WBC8_CYCAE|nr:unnamed protein product [Cyclocybe aegerita]